jgi:hypothetical protein
MFRARWRTRFHGPLIPPAVVLGTAILISLAAAQASAAVPLAKPGAAADCAAPAQAKTAAGRHNGLPPGVAQKLDAKGQFIGRFVAVNAPGRALALNLPIESSVAQPVGDALVYTQSLGANSEVHLIDLATACDSVIARLDGTARSALLDATGDALYVHSVTFPSRSDAGVTRYALDSGAATPVVPSLAEDARFGPTFATQLGWSIDGGALSVQSCGGQACRTRLLNVASGSITTFDAPGQGQIIGVTPTHLVTYGDCLGLPCAVLSTDLSTAATASLADEAWSAALVAADGGPVVQIETAAGTIEVPQ